MEVEIDFTKSAQDNADGYFERAKKAKRKSEGAAKAAKELEESLKKLDKEIVVRKEVKKVEKREWYEKFNWFFASDGSLAIGGRSADQNEELNSKYFENDDLFFHADIFGASAVILKNGAAAGREVKEEAAQFAGSFSSAWENGQSSVDVYSLGREQVTKSRNEGALGKGSFLLKGEREWYRNVRLELCAALDERIGKVEILPETACRRLGIGNFVLISTGRLKKSDAAKATAKLLGYDNVDYLMQHMPAGTFAVKKPG